MMKISNKQLISLFICNLIIWTAGYGLLPLLPVYARQLGANSAVSGYYLAVIYIAITLGALSASWISGRLHRRKLPIIVIGLAFIPFSWQMGQVEAIWALVMITAALWFLAGLGLALLSILAGLSVGKEERGKIFGILAMAIGLGMLLGGLGIGWLVERLGYGKMFSALAIFMTLFPLLAVLLEEKTEKHSPTDDTTKQKSPRLGKSFNYLFIASICSSMAGFFAMLVRSIVMNDLNYSPIEINSTAAIGGLIATPFPLLMGWLSDRMKRKTLLITGYIIALAALVMLAFSKALWHFWIVFVGMGINSEMIGIGNALVTDLTPRESLGKALAVFGSASWIGGILGFTLAGYLLEQVGTGYTLFTGGCLVVAAIGLIVPVQIGSK